MSPPTETRNDRIERLKRKFLSLGHVRRIKEYVRYDRAADGDLPHPFPQEYVEDCRDALWDLLIEHYEQTDRVDKLYHFIEVARRHPSKPFITDPPDDP